MARVRVQRRARREIDEAFDWYLARSPMAAAGFLDAVRTTLATIADEPLRFPVVIGQLRRALLARDPYAVCFKVYPQVISVVGVVHGHRHPESWLSRVDR